MVSTSTGIFRYNRPKHPGKKKQADRGPDCASDNNKKGTMDCDTNNYLCYYNSDNLPAVLVKEEYFYENCCDTFVCKNVITAMAAGTSLDECCRQYNQDTRFQTSVFNKIEEEIKIGNYGGNKDKSIHVYLCKSRISQ